MDRLEHQIEMLNFAARLAQKYTFPTNDHERDWIIETVQALGGATPKAEPAGEPRVYIGYNEEQIPKWMATLGAWLEEETDTLDFEGVEIPQRLRGILDEYFRFDEGAPHEGL